MSEPRIYTLPTAGQLKQRMHILATSETTTGIDIGRAKRGPLPGLHRPRRPTLAGVAKQAAKAGIKVSRYELKPDGSIVLIPGKPELAEPENPWLADLRKDTKQ